MPGIPPNARGGPVPPRTVSGELRQRAFAAEHELAEAQRRIAELEAERARNADRRRDERDDVLVGLAEHVKHVVAAEVERALTARLTPTPAMPQPMLQRALSVPTPPMPFPPLAAPMAYPTQGMPSGPYVAGLPQMRGPLGTMPDPNAYAEQVKSERHVRLVLGIGALVVPLATIIIGAIVSHLDKSEPPTPPPYVRPAVQPPH